MLSLSSSLAAHQRGAERAPEVRVTASARRGGAHLLRWSRIHRGAEAVAPHAACVMANGALALARNDAGTLKSSYPWGPTGANFGFWRTEDTGLAAGAGMALCARSGEALLAYAKGTALLLKSSADNGVTWSAAVTLVTEGAAIGPVAAAFTGSDACLFYGVGAAVKRLRRIAGTWAGAGTAWTNSVATLTGLAACHDGSDFALLVTGTETTTNHRRCWATQMGDLGLPANAWGALVSVAEADAASTSSFAGPALVSIAGEIHGAFAWLETGQTPFTRAFESHPPAGSSPLTTWSEPRPHEALTANGIALAWGNGAADTVFATTPAGVWRCAINAQDTLTPRVLRCSVHAGPRSSRCRVELDNTDGALAGLPSAAFPGTLTGGALALTPGYRSGAGGAFEGAASWQFTIDAIAYRASGGRRTVVLEGSGPWEQLARWRSPQTWQTAAGALLRSQVAARIAGRAGFAVQSAASPDAPSGDWTATTPSFVLTQGERGDTALARLLAPLADGVRSETGALLVTGLASPRFESVMAGLGPLAWWRLHEPANTTLTEDQGGVYSGAAMNGLYAGFAKPGPLVGQSPTSAARFDGADDVVLGPVSPSFDIATFTLAALVKTASAGAGVRRVLSHQDAFGAYYAMGLKDNVPWFGSSHDGWDDTRGTAINNGAWRLLAVTRAAGGLVTWYVDGVAVGTRAAGAGVSPQPAAALTIGATDTLGSHAIAADLSEAAFFNRVLTAAEVAALWRAVSPGTYAYGGTGGHPIVALELVDAAPEVNWLRLQGPDRYADAFTVDDVARHGPRLQTERNLDAGTLAKVTGFAAGALRRAAWDTPAGELRAPFNAGQQLFDLVTVTHAALATAPVVLRVLGLGLEYDRLGGRYESVLALGRG